MQQRLVIVLILLLVSAVRLHQVVLTDFSGDEGELSKMALDFVHGRHFPTKGLFSSQGVYHPPAMVYVMAVPYAVSSHPLAAVIFVTLWNIIGVALLYGIAHFCFGERAALLYSHKTFPQDFHTPFLLAGVWFGLLGFIKGKKWAQALSIPFFFLAPQIHLAGLTLVPLAFYFVWVGRKKISWAGVTIGLLLAFATITPFLVDLKDKDIQQFKDLIFEEEDSGQGMNDLAVRRMVNFAAGLQLENYFTNDVILPEFERAAGWRPKALWSILAVMMLVGMGAVWQKRKFAPLVIGWALLPVVVTSTGAFFPLCHYLNLILPALFLLIGVGAEWLSRHVPLKKITLPVMVRRRGQLCRPVLSGVAQLRAGAETLFARA